MTQKKVCYKTIDGHPGYRVGNDGSVWSCMRRIRLRGSAKDNVSFEQFRQHEEKEFQNTDPAKGNIGACLQMADRIILNDSSPDDLHKKVDEVLALWEK